MIDTGFQVLGLDACADILVGHELLRGISGGQKKRVTTGTYADRYISYIKKLLAVVLGIKISFLRNHI